MAIHNDHYPPHGFYILPHFGVVKQKMIEIAKLIVKLGTIFASFALNPSLFAIGFFCSIAAPERVENILSRVKAIYQQYRWQTSVCTGVCLFLAPHVTLGIASIVVGSSVSCYTLSTLEHDA